MLLSALPTYKVEKKRFYKYFSISTTTAVYIFSADVAAYSKICYPPSLPRGYGVWLLSTRLRDEIPATAAAFRWGRN